MSSPSPRLESAIRAHLQPRLKEDDYSGSGRTFRRLTNGFIQVVSVQGSRYGGQFAINLGIQPISIPNISGNAPDPKRIDESECELRRRLCETGADQWWMHNNTEESMNAAVAAAADVYVRTGRPMLVLLGGEDSPIHKFTADRFDVMRDYLKGFGSTPTRIALVFARLRKAEGRIADAQAFARYGLTRVGQAAALKSELTAIAG